MLANEFNLTVWELLHEVAGWAKLQGSTVGGLYQLLHPLQIGMVVLQAFGRTVTTLAAIRVQMNQLSGKIKAQDIRRVLVPCAACIDSVVFHPGFDVPQTTQQHRGIDIDRCHAST
ncbi:MAG TPA: hypothetical protein EYQ63_02805 [Fuerstia sp.]|nr:hypothetical protein [Fuerstiella sp.]